MQTHDRAGGSGDAPAGSHPVALRAFSSPGTRAVVGPALLAAVLMLLSAASDQFAREPADPVRYGQNVAGELTRNLLAPRVSAAGIPSSIHDA